MRCSIVVTMYLMTMFFEMVGLISSFIFLVVIIDIVTIFVMIFMEKMDPRTFVAWLLLLIFLPILGFVLYLFLGTSLYRKHTFVPKHINDEKLLEAYKLDEEYFKSKTNDLKDERVRDFVHLIKNAGGWAYTDNNDMDFFKTGIEKMDSLFEDLRNARKNILLEYYIIRNDECGNEFMDILIQKLKEGVEVRLLTDAFGNGKGPKKKIYEFKKAGGHFALFHNSANLILSPKKNNRNHRKIAIIDGSIAYCGGINIGNEYLGKGDLGFWRDSSVRIRGSGILPLCMRFIFDWDYAAKKDQILNFEKYISEDAINNKGTEGMQIISGGPDTDESNPIKMQYLAMIRNSKKILYMETPYLIPDDALMEELKCAAMAGVDVRIIIPDKPDHLFVYWNSLSAADKLMRCGVKVYHYHRGFMHSKTIISDDILCSVGSANIDDRSLVLNFETNVMAYSEKLRNEMYDAFMEDLGYSEEYSCEDYARNNTKTKIRIAVSHLFEKIS